MKNREKDYYRINTCRLPGCRSGAQLKKAGILCLAAALALGAAGCGSTDISLAEGTDEIELEVSWWGTDERNSYTMEALKEYSEEHPEIKVNMTYGDFEGFEVKNDVKMFAHTEADIMQVNYQWLDKYQRQGLEFYDLNSVSDVLDFGQYDDAELSYGTNTDGKLIALPIALNVKVIWYNKSIYDQYGLELPETWDDLFAAAQVMRTDGVYPLDLDDSSLWMACVAYAEQLTGQAVFDEQSNFAFTKTDLEAMLEFYKKLVDEKVVERVADRDETKLEKGLYAGTMQWVSGAQKYEAMISSNGQSVAAALPPSQSGEKRMGWYVKPATMYVMGSHTEHPKEAAQLLSYMVQEKGMVSRQALEKGVPCNDKAIEILNEDGVLAGTQYDAALLCEEKNYPLMSPYFEDCSSIFRTAADKVIYGNSSIKKAAETAYEAFMEVGR